MGCGGERGNKAKLELAPWKSRFCVAWEGSMEGEEVPRGGLLQLRTDEVDEGHPMLKRAGGCQALDEIEAKKLTRVLMGHGCC